ncbi:hypothetical protein DAPPUDRAFT_46633 [Daphnia pulex]|uniref:C2HC/C3H-type domain-containing protein n=1 Tax=Daphnia pulex TaxID=6669 RepID=E9G5W7_DAPPU|nr:hypothetical protein DAPPUDRAFT_46633 [Daphnia pulex]|eukprot:EFX84838.1 hypothetical protein DAPPUDRAFT_46633 [Daphnia pulex]
MPRKSIFATGPSAGGKDGLVSCSLCGRNFASDRIEKHEGICAKTKSKKRKVFDITKMRVKGTEAESFVLAPPGRNNQPNTHTTNNKKPISEDGKKADWRKKHESFIEAIRAAKAMQKHLKAGGKVSDLPPPPPSDTSDYITCPYCQRRFAPGAADRHIPKCSTILSNKKTVRK